MFFLSSLLLILQFSLLSKNRSGKRLPLLRGWSTSAFSVDAHFLVVQNGRRALAKTIAASAPLPGVLSDALATVSLALHASSSSVYNLCA